MSKNKLVRAVALGDRVKDRISGFTGIVTNLSYWLNGCIRVGVTPEKLVGGKTGEDAYFDVSQLDIVKAGVHQPAAAVPLSPGGPSRERGAFRQPN